MSLKFCLSDMVGIQNCMEASAGNDNRIEKQARTNITDEPIG